MEKQVWLWAIERVDGRAFYSTDHNEDIEYQGQTYRSNGAFQPSFVEAEVGLDAPNMEILGGVSGEEITLEDLHDGLFLHAKVTQTSFDFEKHSVNEEAFYGEIARIEYSEGRFEAELKAPLQTIAQVFGKSFVKTCQAGFCDEACGLNKRDFEYELSIIEQEGETVRLKGEMPQYPLKNAMLRVPTLPNDLPVRSGSQNEDEILLQLWGPPKIPLVSGDRVFLQAGCDQTIKCCAEIYQNAKNFRGFPHLPSEEILNVQAEQKIARS